MSKKQQPKKPVRNLTAYEGETYKGGRSKRAPNLKKVGYGSVENQYGVRITAKEKRRLESLVNSANAKRNRMLKSEEGMKLFSGGEDVGAKVRDKVMGRESDFVLARKSKSLQRFETKADFKNYIKNLERITKRDYVDKRVDSYKKNFVKGLKNQGFDKETIKRIRNMSSKDFMKLSQSEELAKFGFIYDAEQKENVTEGLRAGIDRIQGVKRK